MKSSPVPNSEILKQVQEAFGEYLREGDGKRRHWPLRLQRLASSAVINDGHKPGAVAKAAGVSRGSILNWCKNKKSGTQELQPTSPSAVELKVVKSRSQVEVASEVQHAIARILFRSGAMMECPMSAVNADLVSALNGGVL